MLGEGKAHIPCTRNMKFYPEIPHQLKTTVQGEENVVGEQPGVRGACTPWPSQR